MNGYTEYSWAQVDIDWTLGDDSDPTPADALDADECAVLMAAWRSIDCKLVRE